MQAAQRIVRQEQEECQSVPFISHWGLQTPLTFSLDSEE